MVHRIITSTIETVREAFLHSPEHLVGIVDGAGLSLQEFQRFEALRTAQARNQQEEQEFQQLFPRVTALQQSVTQFEEQLYKNLDRRVNETSLTRQYSGLKSVEVRPREFYDRRRSLYLPQIIDQLLQTQANIQGWNAVQNPFNLGLIQYSLLSSKEIEDDIDLRELWLEFTSRHMEFKDRLPPNTYRLHQENNARMLGITTGENNLTFTRYGIRTNANYVYNPYISLLLSDYDSRRSFLDGIAKEIYSIERTEQPQAQQRFRFPWSR